MLKGIDISNWQKDIVLENVLPHVDFVICKATEGTGFVDAYCDKWVQDCVDVGKPWGFYHFAGNWGAITEAEFFLKNTRNYFGNGIPVLDWEGNQTVQWVNTFVRHIYEKTGIWCWIYGNPWRFNQGGVESNCARWVASYPPVERPTLDYDTGKAPETDGLVACWQYASDGVVSGYDGNLDVNHFYGDKAAWERYAGIKDSPTTPPSAQSVLENDEYKVVIEKK